MTYKGYLVEEINGSFVGNIKDIDMPEITDGNVLIKVKSIRIISTVYDSSFLVISPAA